jgi:cobalt-zinc-cadmium efflux system membrane fusion protein
MKKYIFSFISIALLAACGGQDKANNTDTKASTPASSSEIVDLTDAQFQHMQIQSAKPSLAEVGTILHLNGKLISPPQDIVQLCVPLGGYVKSSTIMPGQFVNAGTTLAMIENENFIQIQQDYLTAKQNLYLAQKESQRQNTLSAEKATSEKNAQTATTVFEKLKIEVSALKEKLLMIGLNPEALNENSISRGLPLRSPIAGYVTAMNVVPGRLLKPEDVLFEIKSNAHLTAEMAFFEKDMNLLNEDQAITLFSNNQPNEKIQAKIKTINRSFNQDGSGLFYCTLDKVPNAWISGMYVNGEMSLQSPTGITISTEAVVRFEGKQYVFEMLDNHHYAMLEVQTREISDDLIELLVTPDWVNKNLVTIGAYTLLMKLKNTAEE